MKLQFKIFPQNSKNMGCDMAKLKSGNFFKTRKIVIYQIRLLNM